MILFQSPPEGTNFKSVNSDFVQTSVQLVAGDCFAFDLGSQKRNYCLVILTRAVEVVRLGMRLLLGDPTKTPPTVFTRHNHSHTSPRTTRTPAHAPERSEDHPHTFYHNGEER